MKLLKLIAVCAGASGLIIVDIDHAIFNKLYMHSLYFVFFILFLGIGFIIFGGKEE